MTTKQLSRLLARHLAVDDPADLGGNEALDVLNAINDGLAEFYSQAPAILRQATLSYTFRAPQTVSITFSSQYSTTLSSTPFQSTWYGCGLRVDGIAPDNEIRGVSTVLDQWIQPTLATSATVLFDAMPVTASIERITSDVRIYEMGDNSTPIVLRNDANGIIQQRRTAQVANPGQPTFYRFDPVAIGTNGGEDLGLLRIFPAPNADMIARFDAELSAATVTFADIAQGALVPINDRWAALLVHLCEAALSYSPLWRDPATKNEVRERAQDTLARRIALIPNQIACPDNTVGTPVGY